MRLARFQHSGRESLGAVHGEAVIPLPWRDFDSLFALEDPLAAVRAVEPDLRRATIPERLLPPVRSRPQIIGTGGNYADHRAEAAAASVVVSEPVFIPFLWGAVIGTEDDIVIPFPDTQTDYEVELAVVIGRTARRLSPDSAMEHVFGYTVVNDVSAREVMVREKMQVMLCKSPDTFLPVGPHIVTVDEIPDPYDLGIATYLNGEVRQESSTGAMMHTIPDLLSRITRHCTLYPGDIVTTGTPGGVGFSRSPQEFMRPGDTVVAMVEGVGRLRNRLVAGW
jgi:2-keto-4-pentenoate hydratase/2-oxohepta-3-ene-1,7-dioic acid hydratase in catechol pathway